MPRHLALLICLSLLPAAMARAEESSDPKVQLDFFIGTWTIAGEESFRETCRWAPGTRAVLCETESGFSLMGYSGAQKAYTHYALSRDGVMQTLHGWLVDGIWNFVGDTGSGTQNKRVKVTLTPTKAGFAFRQDMSVNGGPWTKEHDFEYVRLPQPAPPS